MSRLIYLAVPYSHPDPAVRRARVEAALDAVDTLLSRGLLVLCGRVFVAQLESEAPEILWPLFQSLIERSDELWVLTLDGWDQSEGIRREMLHARACGKPITHFLDLRMATFVNPL